MSTPELFEDVALHYLADLQHRQRQGAPMTQPTRYIDPFGDSVEAIRWTPSDQAAAGTCIGWLMSAGADFHHPDGSGETTTLTIRGVNGRPDRTARPGDWIVRKWRLLAGVSFAVVTDDVLSAAFTADEKAYR
jgi:hypothetical protein